MFFIDLLAWGVFIFLVYYLIFLLYITSCSSKGRIVDIEKRNYTPKFEQNFTIVVYSHNNASNIINLVESLKKQNYDNDKYSINIILDNCADESAKLLEILGGTRLWRINTDIKPIGRNKAVGWLFERILSSENTNAFIVIEAGCIVKPDFLSKINSEIFDKSVIIGEVQPITVKSSVITQLVNFKNLIKNRVIKHGRFHANLHNFLSGKVWVIRQDVLEKVNFTVTDHGFEEKEFSIRLSKANIQVSTSSQIIVYKDSCSSIYSSAYEKSKDKYKALVTIKNNFPTLFSFKRSLKTKELLLSLFYPSGTIVIALTLLLLSASIFTRTSFRHFITYKYVLSILFVYMIIKAFQLIASRVKLEEYKNAILSIFFTPLIDFLGLLLSLKSNFNIKVDLHKMLLTGKDYNKVVIDTIVSDSKKDLPCKIEIKHNSYNAQAIFIFKEKKLVSTKQSTVDLALAEIAGKLKSHGFNLKTCLNCNYFKLDSQIISKFGGEQGYCIFDNIHKKSQAKEYSYIWNSCSDFLLKSSKSSLGSLDSSYETDGESKS